MREVLVFAYGIDLHPEEIARFCPAAKPRARATAPGWRLGFFGYSRVWDGAEESLIPDPDATVPGVLYAIAPSEAEALEAARGVKLNGTGRYFHTPIDVVTEEGTRLGAVALIKTERRAEKPPSRPYRDRIAEGAALHGLSPEHIAALKALPATEPAYPVPMAFDLPIFAGSCC
ncbi:gamma-glutamylcyclotransferase family protein [Rhodobacter lacus]|uniref:Gamma-glutamylcyclotransferase family protein n=1 Tax=Rhodobacter lacus TaxID=1641972 RepID=A0ABW5AAR7_9RHOB